MMLRNSILVAQPCTLSAARRRRRSQAATSARAPLPRAQVQRDVACTHLLHNNNNNAPFVQQQCACRCHVRRWSGMLRAHTLCTTTTTTHPSCNNNARAAATCAGGAGCCAHAPFAALLHWGCPSATAEA
eukprot:352471-Chlamydomonas_euryale.AAC.2